MCLYSKHQEWTSDASLVDGVESAGLIITTRDDVVALRACLKSFMDTLNDDEKSIFGGLLFADAKPTIHQRLSLPEEAVLNTRERAMLHQVEQIPVDETPAQSSSMVIVLKATRLCMHLLPRLARGAGPCYVVRRPGSRDTGRAAGTRHAAY